MSSARAIADIQRSKEKSEVIHTSAIYKGINVDGRNLNHLRFVDDIVLISSGLNEIIEMISDLKLSSEKV